MTALNPSSGDTPRALESNGGFSPPEASRMLAPTREKETDEPSRLDRVDRELLVAGADHVGASVHRAPVVLRDALDQLIEALA